MPKRFLSYVDETKTKKFGITKEENDLTNLNGDQIQLGCLLRIAESMELMAKDRTELERQNKQLGELALKRYDEIRSLKKAIASYKGKYNKIKKQLAEMEAKCI